MTTTSSLTDTIGSLASGAVSTMLSRLPVTVSASTADTGASTGASTKLTKAAHDFEAIFLRQMMSAADKTDFGSDAFSSQGLSTFRSQQEAQFADIAAGRDTLGIAKLLESRLAAQAGTSSAAHAGTSAAQAGSTSATTASTSGA